MTTSLEVLTEDAGSIAIPARILLDTLKSFGSSSIPLNFKVEEKTLAVEVTSEQGKYKLSVANCSEFPKAPPIECEKSLSTMI